MVESPLGLVEGMALAPGGAAGTSAGDRLGAGGGGLGSRSRSCPFVIVLGHRLLPASASSRPLAVASSASGKVPDRSSWPDPAQPGCQELAVAATGPSLVPWGKPGWNVWSVSSFPDHSASQTISRRS
jgi:hypothetical protein